MGAAYVVACWRGHVLLRLAVPIAILVVALVPRQDADRQQFCGPGRLPLLVQPVVVARVDEAHHHHAARVQHTPHTLEKGLNDGSGFAAAHALQDMSGRYRTHLMGGAWSVLICKRPLYQQKRTRARPKLV